MELPKSKSGLMRYLANGGGIMLVSDLDPNSGKQRNNRWLNVIRTAERVQTQSVRLSGGSWLDVLGARGGDFEFSDDGFKVKYKDRGALTFDTILTYNFIH